MIQVFGYNIVSAFTGGSPVRAIYAYGEKVWPVIPTYFIRWDPVDASGSFSIDGSVYSMEDYSGYFTGFSGVITQSAFSQASITDLFTNATYIGESAFFWCSSLVSVRDDYCSYVDAGAFRSCSCLTDVSLPRCKYIGSYAFYNCQIDYSSGLSLVSFPECEYISGSAFAYCSYLKRADFPKCSYIGFRAFADDLRLRIISFPECEYVGSYAFEQCSSISVADFPKCSFVGSRAFAVCPSLSSVNLPVCERIDSGGLYACQRLTRVYLPSCEYIGSGCFQEDILLSTAMIPVCSYIGVQAFAGCGLLSIDLPVCEFIGDSAFYGCSSLSCILLGLSSCDLGSDAFYGCSNLQSIFVPSSYVSDYVSATNWSDYASLIVGYGSEPGPGPASETITFSDFGLQNREVVDYDQTGTDFAGTDCTVKFTNNSAATKATYYTADSSVRIYKDVSVVIDSTRVIGAIEFTWAGNSYKPTDDYATPQGYDTQTDIWSGSSSSVSLTKPGTGNWRLKSLTVIYAN